MLLVIHVDFDLLLCFRVANGEAVPNLHFLSIFAADAEKGTDYALLVGVTAEGMIKDGENGLEVHC